MTAGWVRVGAVDDAAVACLPDWLVPVAEAVRGLEGRSITRWLPTDGKGRHSAVLLCFGEGPDGPDLLLIERAARMRAHAGQPAFPGGAIDPQDDGPIAAALREAVEETGLDAAGVVPFGTLPDLWLPVSDFVVTPVVAWWREPSPVRAADPREVARVARVSIAALVDPANRARVRHPSGYVGPCFTVAGMLVWGFTAGILDAVLTAAGWAVPWNADRVIDLPEDEPEIEESVQA